MLIGEIQPGQAVEWVGGCPPPHPLLTARPGYPPRLPAQATCPGYLTRLGEI